MAVMDSIGLSMKNGVTETWEYQEKWSGHLEWQTCAWFDSQAKAVEYWQDTLKDGVPFAKIVHKFTMNTVIIQHEGK